MNTSSLSFTDQLEKFGDAQLIDVSAHDIHTSTIHFILTTVFFTGAAIAIATHSDTPKKIYLSALCSFLENHFGINNEKASGLIESNARLYKRYVLIEKIYTAGWEAADNWSQQLKNKNDELKSLLKKYHDLGMSELGIEGTKEQTITAEKVEKTTTTAPAPEPALVVPPPRWKRKVLALTVFILIGGVSYATFFPEQSSALAAILKPMLKHVWELFSELPLDELFNKVRALAP